ncbi:MAG TPA: HAD-IIIA family hydrolase [Candidatus Saccharimonadales bacterium]|nr:HAD-IIIA family hydrolase [Candidatus Saccharimonadales bacterium]
MTKKAVFFDRDGTLIKLVYDSEVDKVDTVSRVEDLEIVYDMPEVLKKLKDLGYLLIIISNQPKVALKKETQENWDKVHEEFLKQYKELGVTFDKEYYCFHHPFSEVEKLKQDCECRKPGIKFFQDSEKELDIDMSQSFMVGDGVNDVLAGQKAGVKTILFGNSLEAGYLSVVQEQLKDIQPDFIVKKPKEILEIIHD